MSGQFLCHICGVMIPTTIYSSNEMNTPFKTYNESGYYVRDNESEIAQGEKGQYIFIGSKCSDCNRTVCISPECSIYYTKRCCMECAKKNKDEFPTGLIK